MSSLTSKHDQLLEHIMALPVGTRISVRQLAQQRRVSEGTAYRAIKEAQAQGFVSTIERVGTVRIERPQRRAIDRLTFAEVVNIVDGTVAGGRRGLYKTLHKFVIGAMELDAIPRYIEPNSLMIVGNRTEVQRLALKLGAAVLVSGGFDVSSEIWRLADERELPVIISAYDTFTIASMINRAIYDRMIKKEILQVRDIAIRSPIVLQVGMTVRDWRIKARETNHSRYPVVDHTGKVVGVVTARDTEEAADETPIERVMSPRPLTVSSTTSVAAAAHMMVWEGIEMLPVVDNGRLSGVITREDVIKAMQFSQRQPQVAETLEDQVMKHFREERREGLVVLLGSVTPQMTSRFGNVSTGVLTMLITNAVYVALRQHRRTDAAITGITLQLLHPVDVEGEIAISAQLIDMSRRMAYLDVTLSADEHLAAKALVSVQLTAR